MRPDGVIHAAALKSVSKSLLNPEEYLDVNYAATVNLLNILKSNNVDNFIFSSTAAVYGSPDLKRGIKETDVTVPISPYGSSKLSAEKAIGDLLEEHQFHGTSLRFFNVVGCSAPELKDNSVENLIPIVLNNIEARKPPIIFGDTYDTPDGTCIRDFVDVRDVARAHLQCLKGLRGLPKIINVGTGQGTSVAQAIKIIQEISESNLEPIFDKARPGDAAHLFADVDLAFDTLGFQAEYSLVDSVKTLFAKNK
jgi:UDP-glucose 4-epimerase